MLWGVIVAAFCIGGVFGGSVVGLVSGKFGRKVRTDFPNFIPVGDAECCTGNGIAGRTDRIGQCAPSARYSISYTTFCVLTRYRI